MISQTSCSLGKKIEVKIISDYCQLHDPLNDELESDVVIYWEKEMGIISTKNKKGGVKTPEEKFVEVITDYAGSNDKKYYDKKCDQQNASENVN